MALLRSSSGKGIALLVELLLQRDARCGGPAAARLRPARAGTGETGGTTLQDAASRSGR